LAGTDQVDAELEEMKKALKQTTQKGS
jgi:hypothetical protein